MRPAVRAGGRRRPGRWRAWHRWTTLVIAAHAFVAAATAASTTSPDDLIAITVNELRRLFHALIIEPDRRIADVITWSIDRPPPPGHRQGQPLHPPSPRRTLKQISCWSS
jgi:hypothetical protein